VTVDRSWAHRLAVRGLGAKSTAIVTNVPGPTAPVYLAGARLVRLTFWVPQAGSVGLGVSILSYAGDVTIGVAADRNLVPDPQVLVAAAEDELADLVRVTLGVPDDAVQLDDVPFDSELAQSLVAEVQQEYVRRYGGQDETPVDPAEFAPPDGTFLVARVGRPFHQRRRPIGRVAIPDRSPRTPAPSRPGSWFRSARADGP